MPMSIFLSPPARRRALADVARPPKVKVGAKQAHVPATTLRNITLETIRRLGDVNAYNHNCMSTTAQGKSAGIWSSKAVIFSELGHIWRAADKVFSETDGERYRRQETRITRAAELIDAQIRYFAKDAKGNEITMVSLAVVHGRLKLIEMLRKVAERLQGGDSMIIEPMVYQPAEELKKSPTEAPPPEA